MLAQAKKLDNIELINGDVLTCYKKSTYIKKHIDWMEYEIDSQTLKYSFDNGENWYSEEEIHIALNILENSGKEIEEL